MSRIRSGRRNRGDRQLWINAGERERDDEPGDLLQLTRPVQAAEYGRNTADVAYE